MHFVGLLWPLLTSRSAGRPNNAMPASPFQASGETSPGKNDDLPRTIAGSTPLPLGRRSFAVSGPLAPVRSASYPVPVRRLTGSFHASFSVRLTTNALRFPSVPATRFREDFHLQVIAHAGPTTKKKGAASKGSAPRKAGELGSSSRSGIARPGRLSGGPSGVPPRPSAEGAQPHDYPLHPRPDWPLGVGAEFSLPRSSSFSFLTGPIQTRPSAPLSHYLYNTGQDSFGFRLIVKTNPLLALMVVRRGRLRQGHIA